MSLETRVTHVTLLPPPSGAVPRSVPPPDRQTARRPSRVLLGRQSQDLSAGAGPERGPGVSGASASAGWVAVTPQELEESP